MADHGLEAALQCGVRRALALSLAWIMPRRPIQLADRQGITDRQSARELSPRHVPRMQRANIRHAATTDDLEVVLFALRRNIAGWAWIGRPDGLPCREAASNLSAQIGADDRERQRCAGLRRGVDRVPAAEAEAATQLGSHGRIVDQFVGERRDETLRRPVAAAAERTATRGLFEEIFKDRPVVHGTRSGCAKSGHGAATTCRTAWTGGIPGSTSCALSGRIFTSQSPSMGPGMMGPGMGPGMMSFGTSGPASTAIRGAAEVRVQAVTFNPNEIGSPRART